METFTDSTGLTLYNVHSKEACEGRPCVIHNPSNHHMKDWPLVWRTDRLMFERICEHGVGHPDPDDLAYKTLSLGEKEGHYHGIHGCDGCCSRRTVK